MKLVVAEMSKQPQQASVSRSKRQPKQNASDRGKRQDQPKDAKESVPRVGDDTADTSTRVFTRGNFIRSRFEALEAEIKANGTKVDAVLAAVTEIKGCLSELMKGEDQAEAGDEQMETTGTNEVGGLSWARIMSEDADMNAKLLADFQASGAGSPDIEQTLDSSTQFELNTANIIAGIKRKLKEDAGIFESGTAKVGAVVDNYWLELKFTRRSFFDSMCLFRFLLPFGGEFQLVERSCGNL